MKQPKTPSLTFIAIVLLFFGAVAITIPCLILQKTSNYIEILAKVTDIHYDIINESYTAYVSYSVNGVEYNQFLDFFQNSFKVGKMVSIRYNPQNPADITGVNILRVLPFLIIGGLFVIGAFTLIVIKIVRNVSKKRENIKLDSHKENDIEKFFKDEF